MNLEPIKCPCCGQITPPTGEVEVDLQESRLRFRGHSISLTRRLAKLAYILSTRMPASMSHEDVTTRMWGDQEIDVIGNLKVAVCQLRAKLKPLGLDVLNSWGVGYRIEIAAPKVSRTAGFSTVTGEDYAQA